MWVNRPGKCFLNTDTDFLCLTPLPTPAYAYQLCGRDRSNHLVTGEVTGQKRSIKRFQFSQSNGKGKEFSENVP